MNFDFGGLHQPQLSNLCSIIMIRHNLMFISRNSEYDFVSILSFTKRKVIFKYFQSYIFCISSLCFLPLVLLKLIPMKCSHWNLPCPITLNKSSVHLCKHLNFSYSSYSFYYDLSFYSVLSISLVIITVF